MCCGVATAAMGYAVAAQAQAPAAGGPAVEAVVVTGSRVIRDGTQAPSPVTVMSLETLQAAAPVSISDALTDLPQIRGSTTTQTNGINPDNAGANYLNVRALGAIRALVLLDGKRVVTTAATGTVDMNTIPQALIERVETITGGASAAYGSNAVAGVLNLIIDKRFTGMKAEVQVGQTALHDDVNYKGSVAFGGGFLDGRGHVVVSAEYARSEGIERDLFAPDTKRPFTNNATVFFPNPAVTAANPASASNPRNIIISNVRFTRANQFGVVQSGPFKNQQFNADGTLRPYNPGSPISGQFAGGGEGWNWLWSTPLDIPYIRNSFFTHGEFDIVPNVTAYADVFHSYNHGYAVGNPVYTHGAYASGFAIKTDNPYLAASTVSAMTAAGQAQLLVNVTPQNLERRGIENLTNTTQGTFGLKGDLSGWAWDAFYSYAQNDAHIDNYNNINLQNFGLAIDAVRAPTGIAGVTAGSIVCRSTLTSPSNGCLPINMIGNNPLSKAVKDYVTGTNASPAISKQEMFEASLSRDLFTLPAGPLGIAAGVHLRKESVTRLSDPVSKLKNPLTGQPTGAWIFGNLPAFSGETTVKEVFGEANAPLLQDVTLAKSLSVNGAFRHTDYDLSGGVNTWKVGLSYEPITGLRFRATKSRDIRAPNVLEYFSPSQQGQSSVIDRLLNKNVSTLGFTGGGGGAKLRPEIGDTITYGFVYQPEWLPGFTGAIDRYEIEITDAIASLGTQLTIDQCAEGNADLCAQVVRDPVTREIQYIKSDLLNLNSLVTSGIDIDLGYRRPLADLPLALPGNISLRLMANHLEKQVSTTPGSAPRDTAGSTTLPNWRAIFNATYDNGPFSSSLAVRMVGKAKFDPTFTEIDLKPEYNEVAPEAYVDLSARYKFEVGGGQLELFGTIENLFEPIPPDVPGGFNGSQTSRGTYDVFGRQYRVGLRAKF